jgi:acyl carrier protein
VKSGAEVRDALRGWLVKANGNIRPEQVKDDTPLFDAGVLSSLKLVELIAFVEQLSGNTIDVAESGIDAFHDLNTIVNTFFRGGGA